MIIEAKAIKTITQVVLTRITTHITMIVIYAFIFLVVAGWVMDYFRVNWDDSDGATERSGLSTYTDCLTGVQYLSVGVSAPAVRVDKAGKPVVNLSGCY